MGRIRIYPTKESSIASGAFQNYNSSQNAVAELWYGGGLNSGKFQRHSIARHLIQFDLSNLESKIADYQINTALTITYRLKMKNAIARDVVLEKAYEFDRLERSIAASYDLIVFPINKAWDEGRGYDMVQNRYAVRQYGNPLLSGYSNWNFATSTVAWDQSGVYTDPTASTSSYVSQHFAIGDEDLNVDVTNMVEDWLSGGSTNYGFAIAFDRTYELMSSNTRYISSFFTHNTNYYHKPYLEVIFDDQLIKDDRGQMTNNRSGRLFFYGFSGNSAANYLSASTVNILNSSNAIVHSNLTPTHLEKGVYYVDVFMSGATRGQKYKDVWSGVTFNAGYDRQDITQEFIIQDNYYTANIPDINAYVIDVYGMPDGQILYTDEMYRVFCDLRVNYSHSSPKKSYSLKYRMVLNNQEEVIPWTEVNQTHINGCMRNYFLLDTSWLLHNQTYKIQFKIEEWGTSRIMPNEIDFKVLRPFGENT